MTYKKARDIIYYALCRYCEDCTKCGKQITIREQNKINRAWHEVKKYLAEPKD